MGIRFENAFTGRKRWITVTTVLVLGAAAAGVWWKAGQGPDEARAQAVAADESTTEDEDVVRVPVELASAESRDLPSRFTATGTLEARRAVDLISRVPGQITRLAVEEGDWVERGQVLLEIDHREQALLVEEARVRVATAKRELERREDMAQRGLETDRALEEARQTYEVSEAQYELAKVRLEDHIVRAPYAGRVTVRHVELGQTVQNGTGLIGLADTDPMQVRLFLPERVVTRLAEGQPVEIHPDVAPEETLTGTVERVAPVVDASTSTVKVTLKVEDAGAAARSGSFVRARITTDVRQDAIAVPKKALVAEAGATYLFVAEADSVRRVTVETGYADDTHVEILDGISPGERVVVVGQGGLRQGSRIEELPGPATVKAKQRSGDGAELAQRF